MKAALPDVGTRRGLAIGLAAVGGLLVAPAITGTPLADRLWGAGLAALAALLGSHARRGPLLVAGALVAAAAGTAAPILTALGAVVAAIASTRRLHRRAPFTRGVAGGLVAVSLLATSGDLPLLVAAPMWVAIAVLLAYTALPHIPDHQRRTARRSLVAIAGLVLVASGVAAYGVATASRSVGVGTRELAAGLAAARDGDVEGAALHFDASRVSLEAARADVRRLGAAARAVPVVAQHVEALDEVLSAADDATSLAALTAGATDVEDLTVTDGRIDVDAIGELVEPLQELATALDAIGVAVDDHGEEPLLPQLRGRMDELADEARAAADDARLGADAAAVVPGMLGRDGPRRYLVLFTTPSEARGRFGFPGSYAEVVIDDGRFDLVEDGSVSTDLFGRRPDQAAFDVGDPDLLPYVPLGPTRDFRSVTIPPEFPVVAEVAAAQWTAYDHLPVDGVLRFDPAALAALMLFTGPVQVDDVSEPLTAFNIEQFLVVGQYVQFPDETAPRRELLDAVSEVTFQRLEDGDLPSPRVLADLFAPIVRQQHLQASSFDPSAQAFLTQAGMTGTLPRTTRDTLLVTAVNSVGNKIDSFLRRTVRYDAEVHGDQLSGTLGIDLENTAPATGLPLYVVGNLTVPPLPVGTNRSTVLAYTSVPASEVLVDGVPVPRTQSFTGGRWLNLFTVELAPGQRRTATLSLAGDLPDEGGGGGYDLEVVPGGGATPDDYAIHVRGDVEVDAAGPVTEITRHEG